jgi:hypothetical protein
MDGQTGGIVSDISPETRKYFADLLEEVNKLKEQ